MQTEQEKTQNSGRFISLVGALLILFGMSSRYFLNANSPETRAIELLKNKQYDQAIAEIDKGIQDNPKNVEAWTIKGNIYTEIRTYDQALQAYDQALSLNPDNVHALSRRCMLHVAMNAFDPAIEDCTRALEHNPEDAVALMGRAMGYEAENQHDLALKDAGEAIGLMPDKEFVFWLRGMIYSNKGQLDDARKDFNKAQTLDPNAKLLLLSRGILNVLQGVYGDAITDLERAAQQTPVEPYSLVWLHLAKMHAGQDDKQELEQAMVGMKDDKWPASVVALYVGRATVETVRAQAASGAPSVREEQACEADYFIGEYYLQQHERDNAKRALNAAIDSCPKAMSNEKQAAIAEFKTQGF